jgi:serine/threonine protein kinase/WD40 repeat protein
MSESASTPPQAGALLIDQRQRWKQGERVLVEEYLRDQPALSAEPGTILDLLYHEILLREERGETPHLEEYVRRFPQFPTELHLYFEVHAALEAVSATSPGISDMAPAAPHVWPTVPGYEILAVIGHGGMGVVYKARHQGLNRLVALKMIGSSWSGDPERLARFRSEAEAVARLQSPHIVQIHDIGQVAGKPYFALELIDGGSLAEHLSGAPAPQRRGAALVETVARAIHHAHERGIVHRDLKPANILLQRRPEAQRPPSQADNPGATPFPLPISDFEPKVTDFGLAKFLEDRASAAQTQSGDILGTPSYMAPEQASGISQHIGPATDIYALGAVLYEVLTGRPPFRGITSLDTLQQVRFEAPVPPRRLQPRIALDLETISLKCLEKEANKRYSTALALADDLARFLAGQPIHARPVSQGEKLWRWCGRKPLVASLLACVSVLVLLIGVGTPLAAFLWREQRDEARQKERHAASAELDAREKLRQSYLTQAVLLRSTKQSGQRFEGLELLREASSIRRSPDLRNAAIACLALPDLKIAWHRPLPEFGRERVAFDALVKRYAYLDDQRSHISVRSVADDRELVALPGPRSPAWTFTMKFSPDGRHLAAIYTFKDASPSKVLVWDLSKGAKILEQPSYEDGAGLDFSPDSSSLALVGSDGSISIFAIARGQELSRLQKSCRPHTLAFDPTGRRLAVSSMQDKVVEIRDLDKGGRVETKFAHPSGVYQSAWRGDGKLLATGCNDRNAYVWDVSANRQLASLSGHKHAVPSVAFNHTGDLLASGSWDGTTKLWDAICGVNLLTMQGVCLHFAGDDEHLAYIDGPEFGIWQVAGRRECRTLHFGRIGRPAPEVDIGGPWSVDFSSDGQLLAAAGEDGVRLWDMPAGREVAHLPTGHSKSALFLPEETSLIIAGHEGLQLWPIERDHAGHGEASLGPPVLLRAVPNSVRCRVALSQDGNKIAYLDYANKRIIVMDGKTSGKPVELKGLPRQQDIALSPTGRWAAVGNWKFIESARVWDLTSSTTTPSWQLQNLDPDTGSCSVAFSPDSQWLVTSEQDKYRFWQVGSWAPGLEIPRDRLEPTPGPLAFSRDSRMLAIARSAWTVQLIEPATGEEIATLSAPDTQIINSLGFSPDAGHLAVATNNHTIQLWDLRLIQQQLEELNLEGDLSISR